MIYNMRFGYGISRGRDTEGYNIVSLWVNGSKVASTCGGGYDMQGTVLGDWLGKTFQSQLLAYFRRRKKALDCWNRAENTWIRQPDNKRRNCGATGTLEKGKLVSVSLDGGTGKDCMERIAKDILGLKKEYCPEKDRALWVSNAI